MSLETYSFWDDNVTNSLLLVLSNIALIPAIFYLVMLREVVTALLLIWTIVFSSLYHSCRAGVFCLFKYEQHVLGDYLSVYISIIWILTFLGIRNSELHVFAFFFSFMFTLLVILGQFSYVLLPIIGIGLPAVIAVSHACLRKHRMFYSWPWAVATFVLAGLAGVFMFFMPKDDYGWAHSLWHLFSMLSAWTFAIAITPYRKRNKQ